VTSAGHAQAWRRRSIIDDRLVAAVGQFRSGSEFYAGAINHTATIRFLHVPVPTDVELDAIRTAELSKAGRLTLQR
jgi:hypothetical protein